MFTGIVESLGEVVAVDRRGEDGHVSVRADFVADLAFGESVAINGVCLTVTAASDGAFTADVMPETLRRSTLGALRPGDHVNLERAVTPATRLGGHFVQGHVDGVGTVMSRAPGPRWDDVRIAVPCELARYVAAKGSIAVDGVSLTVVDVADEAFSVGLIPTTLQATTLGERQPGDPVNIETDVMAKYVERLLDARVGQAR
ncbi:MAG: riboflavin synthase [Actinomycetes bacterium]